MGSKSNNGWWKSLFQRSNRSRHEAGNEQLGGYPDGAFSGQTSVALEYYTEQLHNEQLNITLDIQFVCACGSEVYKLHGEDNFGCLHCDSVCLEQMCDNCVSLNLVDRFEEDEEDEEGEDDADI